MPDIKEKERILETSREKFFEFGFLKVTIDEIAADLRMSKKTLYKFFPSKEDLIKAVVHHMMKRVSNQVDSIVQSPKPFDQKMTELLAFIGKMWGRAGRQFPIDMKRNFPELWKEIEAFRRERVLTQIQKMFLQGQQERILRQDMNTDLFMLMFLSCVEGILNPTTLSEYPFSMAEAFKGIFKILFEGALTDESRARFHLFEPTYSPTI